MADTSRKNELLYRVYAVLLAFFLFAILIAYRVVTISVVEGDKWRAKKESDYMKWQPLTTQRGNIYADDGQSLLATSVEFFEIRMDPSPKVIGSYNFNQGIDGLCVGLAKYDSSKSAAQWKSMIEKARKNGSRFLLIAKKVDHFGLEELSRLPIFKLGRYEGGFMKIPEYQREKPYRQLASRVIGVDRETHRVGLEHSFNRLLRGEERKVLMKRMSQDLYIPVEDPTDFEIIKGKDIHTTINVPMQDIVHNELLKGLQSNSATGGTAIIMEVKTGKIMAMSNLSYNKNGKIGEFQNFAVAHRSEPGSTMKAATVLALLEDDYANSNSIIDFRKGKRKFYDQWMYDSGYHNYSKSTLRDAFEISSNVAIAGAAFDAYEKTKNRTQFADRLRQFGLHQASGIEIDGEPKPFIKHPKINKGEWYGTTIPWMSHGYEMEMTPLQVLRFYNAIANDGKLMDAQLVSAIVADGKIEKSFQPKTRKEQIASLESIRELQSMLEGVIQRGTGRKLKSKYYQFAGKTGTTKVGYAGDGQINYNASFVGYWPAKNPQYSMIVVVYGLTGNMYYGNQVAGPVFKRVMDWTYAIHSDQAQLIADAAAIRGDYKGDVYGYADDYNKIFKELNVRYMPSGKWIKGHSGREGEVLNGKAKIAKNIMPDLEGMGLRDAVYVLENLGMDVNVNGFGKVSKQSLKAGKSIKDREITLYLN